MDSTHTPELGLIIRGSHVSGAGRGWERKKGWGWGWGGGRLNQEAAIGASDILFLTALNSAVALPTRHAKGVGGGRGRGSSSATRGEAGSTRGYRGPTNGAREGFSQRVRIRRKRKHKQRSSQAARGKRKLGLKTTHLPRSRRGHRHQRGGGRRRRRHRQKRRRLKRNNMPRVEGWHSSKRRGRMQEPTVLKPKRKGSCLWGRERPSMQGPQRRHRSVGERKH